MGFRLLDFCGQPFAGFSLFRRQHTGEFCFGTKSGDDADAAISPAVNAGRTGWHGGSIRSGKIAASASSPDFVSEAELTSMLSPEQRESRKRLAAEIQEAESHLWNLKDAKAFAVTPMQPEPTYRLKRGNPQEKAELVSPGGLGAVKNSDFGLNPDAPEAERRRKLAEWIASERNPLFARALVNRVWQYHFGRGLVDTPNDLASTAASRVTVNCSTG